VSPRTSGRSEGAPSPTGSYREGRVDSISERPVDSDGDDRSAEGDRPGVTRSEEGRSPDAFVSSEVNDRTSQPMKDSKTRS
jgi:hypothetical protein